MKKESDNIAIFLDVENLTKWIKEGGPEHLLGEINPLGRTIVRRAYGNWTSNAILNLQAYLNRLGFELVHTYHPVSGKNSSDIQMTVDVIEYAWNVKSVTWFVLATGDSDFSPLFRRLREMGREVIGVGPRSTLSETVKTSCSRFIYTEAVIQKGDIAVQSAYEDAVDNTLKVLSAFGNKIHLSKLKNQILNIDSAFDEKQLGFSSFSVFVESIENITVSAKNTMCELQAPEKLKQQAGKSIVKEQTDLVNI
ncbi:MAG: NYN domain-containing protein, partial [Candidatus Electrothrix sp. ATG1]|nr:NYN domain-containing protein [Candidatus Electrothrix sp. ATG1]